MKRILIILLLIITFSWLSMPEITLAEGIGDSFSGGSRSSDRPVRQRSAGRRGVCPSSSSNNDLSLIPLRPIPQKLMPKIKDNSIWLKPPITITTKGNPTFWFYISEPPTSDKKAEFMLLNENSTYAINNPIPSNIPKHSKLFSFPPDEQELKDGSYHLKDGLYHWFFTIICDVQQPSRNQNFEGWIEKVPVSKNLELQLAEASEAQQIEIYFQNKIWHEFVNLIARKQQDIPNEKITLNQKSYTIGEVWNQILTEVGL